METKNSISEQTKISVWDFHGSKVRTVSIDGEPWWVAKDVCDILEIVNGRDAVSKLDNDEKGVVLTDTLGGKQQMSSINESGLYALIVQSRKPEAKAFRKWVTSEVLPQIRKTGSYGIKQDSYMFVDPVERAKKWIEEELERKRLADENSQKQALIEQQTPKVEYFDSCINSNGYLSMEQAAKTLGTGRNRLFDQLRSLGIIMHGRTTPYQQYIDSGYFIVREITVSDRVYTQTFVTTKGMPFIHDKITKVN